VIRVLTLVTYWQVCASEALERFRREEGQTMAEYGVVLAVIALAVIAAITLLSTHVRDAITSVANLLPGG
jgi:pilus assembly protein Flp/PilA